MLRRRISALLIFGFLLLATPLLAAESGLDAISTDASVVVRLKNPKATIEKIASFIDMVQPGFGTQVRTQGQMIGVAISNPTLGGVDMTADWYMAVYATGGDAEPGVVFVVPATDVKAMKEALGEGMKFQEFGKWGVYTTDTAAAEKSAARIKGTGKSIATVIDKDSSTSIDKGDLAVFINVSQLATAYKSKLADAKEKAAEALNQLSENAPGPAGANLKAMSGTLTSLVKSVLQGVEDTKSCVISVAVSKQGIAIEDLVKVTAGSATDKFLQKSAPSAMEALATLPAGNLGYFGIHFDMASMMQFGASFMDLLEGSDETKKEMKGLLDEMGKLKFGTMAAAFGLGNNLQDGAIRSTTIMEVNTPAKLRELNEKQLKLMGSVKSQGVKQTYDIKKDAEKYGANSADVVTMKMQVGDADDPATAMVQQLMSKLYGPEGMVSRIVYLKDRMVQTMGGGKEAMTKALASQSAKSNTSPNAAFDLARKQLGAKANLIVLFDLPMTVANAAKLVVESGLVPIPLEPAMLEGLQLKESYLGFSIGTEPQGIRVNTHIPVEQVQGMTRLAFLVFSLRQQQN